MARKNIQYQNRPGTLRFEDLPFYKLVEEMIKPTSLPMSTRALQFSLYRNQATFCHYFRQCHNSECKFQFQIRIGKILGSSLVKDYLPPGLRVHHGSSNNQDRLYESLQRTLRVTKPINCTAMMIFDGIVKDQIFTQWTPDKNNYAITFNIVEKLTVTSLIEELWIKGAQSSKENLEKTKNYIINLADDCQVVASGKSANYLSLICPLSKKIMEIPVKSIYCDHLQCFDAKTFLLMNEQTPKWMCPICDLPCQYVDLEIQYYFFEVLSSSSGDCRSIEFKSDGTWIEYEKNEM